MRIEPYLFLEGRADEAIAFYTAALGAEVLVRLSYGENPDAGRSPAPMLADKVMHATLKVGDATLMLSDGLCSGTPAFQGFSVSLTVDDDAKARAVFAALAERGQVRQALGETFFATSFGMVADRFGVGWMVMAPRPMA